jgi:uncharacterized protein (DUF1499 family)
MRRLILEEPVSRAALWARRVALFALAATLLAALLVRTDRVETEPGLAALAAGLGLAVVAVLLAFAAFVRIWTEGSRGLGLAVRGLLVALLVLGYPLFLAARALTLPALTDVSTDIDNPPAFSRSRAALQARDGRVPPDPTPETRARQRAAYARIAPLTLDLAPEEAFEIARRAAANRGWQIIEAVKPGGRIGIGRIEAVARSLVLKLPDDVTVRVRPIADGARIDVRSASRLGPHDLGQNADRIRAYYDEVSRLAIATK